MARIALVTQLHPCTNPRPVKEANTLAQAGHQVYFVTNLIEERLIAQDRAVLDSSVKMEVATDLTRAGRIAQFNARTKRRLGTALLKTGLESRYSICHEPNRLLRRCLDLDCDLYIGHIEGGLWAGRELAKRGKRVAFDIEDWHSRDGLPEAQKGFALNLISELEQFACRQGAWTSTTSVPLAEALAGEYASDVPTVIYNVFPQFDAKQIGKSFSDRTDRTTPSLTWFSQTIGRGRGLEELWQALRFVKQPVQIHLRGNERLDFSAELRKKLPSHHKLYIHGLVPHAELLNRISEHDIGMAIERSTPPSRDLTLTNKIFQYLQAGCAVVATKTSGQLGLGEQHSDCISLADHTPEAMAAQINQLIENPKRLAAQRDAARRLSEEKYNWDVESCKLLNLVNKALATPTTGRMAEN